MYVRTAIGVRTSIHEGNPSPPATDGTVNIASGNTRSHRRFAVKRDIKTSLACFRYTTTRQYNARDYRCPARERESNTDLTIVAPEDEQGGPVDLHHKAAPPCRNVVPLRLLVVFRDESIERDASCTAHLLKRRSQG